MPTTPRGNASRVIHGLGPGQVRIASIGSAEPIDLVTAWPSAWVNLGYTEEGSEWSYELKTDAVEVAEEVERISTVITGRDIKVGFASAEPTVENLKTALNGGTIVIDPATVPQFVTFEPPDLGTELRVMVGFESEDAKLRQVWRQCLQTGSLKVQRRKGSNKATLPMEFDVEKPSAGGKPFKIIQARTLSL
ncbi:hypothetical protein [Nocardioides sp.]|uniref:phage tail tube protein n=1 Tax=Nocardioides sp. TaxID=35761 RepID=UPI002BCCE3E5|nr:hypothetical protein [Nocardioides sp.]HXH77157.1 hypothetical protein [Nocardioides sp.]